MTDNKLGLFKKYDIRKSDGSALDENFEGFVLRLDANGETSHHDASIKAIETYAEAIYPNNPLLAHELLNKYSPSYPSIPAHWEECLNCSLEQWEKNQGLTLERKRDYYRTALVEVNRVIGSLSQYLVPRIALTDYRHDDDDCTLDLHLDNSSEYLLDGQMYLPLFVAGKTKYVSLMIGEDGDEEVTLNIQNVSAFNYLQTYAKP